jgi:putative ABC transport system permease protein
MLITLFGLTSIITLVLSIPLYVDAVHHRILLDKTTKLTSGGEEVPYSFRFEFYGLWSGKNQWEDVEHLDRYLTGSSSQELALPMLRISRLLRTDLFKISQSASTYPGLILEDETFGLVSMGVMSEFNQNIKLVDGALPEPAGPDPEGVIEGLISQELANKFGIQVGEEYTLIAIDRQKADSPNSTTFPIRVAGVWIVTNPRDPYWFIPPSSLDEVFIIPFETFTQRVSPHYDMDVSSAIWHLVLDGAEVNADEVSGLLERIAIFEEQASKFLPNFRMNRSPVNDLRNFQRSAQHLMILIYAFAIPIISLIVLFIILMTSLSIERRKNEIAVLRSRGATAWQVLGTIILESFLLGLIALAIAFPSGALVTQGVGLSRSFMDFSAQTSLTVRISQAAFIAGIVTVVFISVVSIFPAIPAVKHTIISYKQERARRLKKPLWQRIMLDIFLLIPALYGSYLLWQRGSMMSEGISDPLNDPLLYLVPSLLVFSFTLLLLRAFPHFLSFISNILEHTHSVGILLATRQLSRSRGYEIPLIILVLTLSLSIYTASLAQTLDRDLEARIHYQTGSDVRFLKVGHNVSGMFSMTGQSESSSSEPISFPVSEYLKISGVTDATRVGYYPIDIRPISAPSSTGVYMGIERLDFPRITYWRDDFAGLPLPFLLNALGAIPEGVLVNSSFLDQSGLQEGDPIELAIYTDLGRIIIRSRIVGSFDFFPTWYEEEDGPLFIGNLDYLFDQAGGYMPYQVWVNANQNFDHENIRDLQIGDFNVRVLSWLATEPKIEAIRERPEQQGIFGFLFVGYLSSAVMTVVGFLLYALYSFQWRFVELGVLRASGLSRRQLAVTLAFELLFLISIGGIAGTTFGVSISRFYIPFLQMGNTPVDYTPPFEVVIAWDAIFNIYVIFSLLFTITLSILLAMLLKMKIFQAIKLGETL